MAGRYHRLFRYLETEKRERKGVSSSLLNETMNLAQCCSHGLHLPKLLPSAVALGEQPSLSFTFLSPASSSHSLSRTPTRPSKSLTRASKPDKQPVPQFAIHRIAEKLRNLGYGEDDESPTAGVEADTGKIFIPLPERLPKVRIGHTIDTSWSTPENPVPEPGSSSFIVGYNKMRGQVKEMNKRKVGMEESVEDAPPTLAELRLSEEELRRLRGIGIRMKKKLKIGKAGITEGVVNGIHERWRNAEVVRITCVDLLRRNMKRTHDLLERTTGGLVVWRAGSNIILYRGADYTYPYFLADDDNPNDNEEHEVKESSRLSPSKRNLVRGVGSQNKVRFQLPGEVEITEEAERLLQGLGPRYSDWWGYEPLPVDADLLPAVVEGYRKPFRLLPYGVHPKLTNDEMTTLRRLGRPLPCHFALGRNRNLQGLAAAIVKLWEKCEIAKIAVKRGVQNTNNEMMAEEIRLLTGGTLISRDKEFIVLYRGKDFLPPAVSSAIEERRKHIEKTKATEVQEEATTCASGDKPPEPVKGLSVEEAITNTAIKICMALEKKAEAEKLLEELDKSPKPEQPDADKEGITEEERYMMRKVGLRMKAFLLLGRRGVFDGTVENMHLHWKYRELVKIMCKEKSIESVYHVARTLETESGGILVAVERVSREFAIIMYRGKNYQRPAIIRPTTLLTKREALKRSIESQRRESLKLHVLKLSEDIDQLKLQMEDRDNERRALQPSKQQGSSICEVEDDSISGNISCDVSVSMESEEEEESNLNDATDQVKPELQKRAQSIEYEEGSSSLGPTEYPSRKPRILSKTERLLLRKQALTMKKRPVLAIGRSNVVIGIAKAIKAHFKKHPLAIVNVNGRARGTSMQEMVFKLQEATGAVFVSQEPNKVILYRGWGKEEEEDEEHHKVRTSPRLEKPQFVSPELIAAIKLECGIIDNNEVQQESSQNQETVQHLM